MKQFVNVRWNLKKIYHQCALFNGTLEDPSKVVNFKEQHEILNEDSLHCSVTCRCAEGEIAPICTLVAKWKFETIKYSRPISIRPVTMFLSIKFQFKRFHRQIDKTVNSRGVGGMQNEMKRAIRPVKMQNKNHQPKPEVTSVKPVTINRSQTVHTKKRQQIYTKTSWNEQHSDSQLKIHYVTKGRTRRRILLQLLVKSIKRDNI